MTDTQTHRQTHTQTLGVLKSLDRMISGLKIEEEVLFSPRSFTSRDSNALKYFELTEIWPWKSPNSANENPMPFWNCYEKTFLSYYFNTTLYHETYILVSCLFRAIRTGPLHLTQSSKQRKSCIFSGFFLLLTLL